MSIEIMSYAWKHSRAKGASLLVLLAIADHARDDGKAWPGLESIAYKTRVNKRTVQRAIDELEALGEIKVLRQGVGRTWSIYRVLKSGMIREDEEIQEIEQEDTRGDIHDTRGDIHDTRGGYTPPESLLKQPSIKQTSKTLSAYADADFKTIESAFCEAYTAETGSAYLIKYGACRKGLKPIIKQYGVSEILSRIGQYFTLDAKYYGRDILTFLKNWNKIPSVSETKVERNPTYEQYLSGYKRKYPDYRWSDDSLKNVRREWEEKYGAKT